MSADGRLPILLIPGLLCDETVWAPQITRLTTMGWDCQIAGVGGGATVEAMAGGILEGAPSRFHLVGLSMGSYVAFAIERTAPQMVESLSVIGASARSDTPRQSAERQQLVRLAEDGSFPDVVETLLARYLRPATRLDRDQQQLVAAVRSMMIRAGVDTFRNQQSAIVARADVRETLEAISCPVLVLCGQEDAINPPSMSEEIADLIPTSRCHVLPECGHLATLEAAGPVTDLLGTFLERAAHRDL